jgi:NADH dehydrogenase
MKIAVTGARSYSGKYVTRRLLALGADVITLTGHPDRPDPFSGQVRTFPLDFGQPELLEAALEGSQVLVNTYWIRFDRGSNTQARAVENTRRLVAAAARAGVRRIVHISITNPSIDSDLTYFRGKAENEAVVQRSGIAYAILRPTVLFGAEDILINNIAYFLRRFPFFLIAGHGDYRLQPIYVDDLAAMVQDCALAMNNVILDAVGPEIFTFRELVEMVGRTVAKQRPVLSVHPSLLLLAARLLSIAFGDVIITPQEVEGLMANLLVSAEPPRGQTKLSRWLEQNRGTVGRRYASELKRHYM